MGRQVQCKDPASVCEGLNGGHVLEPSAETVQGDGHAQMVSVSGQQPEFDDDVVKLKLTGVHAGASYPVHGAGLSALLPRIWEAVNCGPVVENGVRGCERWEVALWADFPDGIQADRQKKNAQRHEHQVRSDHRQRPHCHWTGLRI